MADNLAVTPGAGATIRTLDVGGIHIQGVALFDSSGHALSVGADGSLQLSTTSIEAQLSVQEETLRTLRKILLVLMHMAGVTLDENAGDDN